MMTYSGKPFAVAADIGGTKARFAVCDLDGSHLKPLPPLQTRAFRSVGDAIKAALKDVEGRPERVSLAVAAPVTGQTIELTNADWSFTEADVREATGASRVNLLNDFVALAHVLRRLTTADLAHVCDGQPDPDAPSVILGPGTGLGASSYVNTMAGWQALASEGGHMTFGATSNDEWQVHQHLFQHHGHVSMERVVSGAGIEAIFTAFGGAPGTKAADIVQDAREGDALAGRTVGFFASVLARFAGDMALMLGARGGVYLGGGICPRLLAHLDTDAFREAFRRKGRMSDYLSAVPVHVIMARDAGLRGAAAALSDLMTEAERAGVSTAEPGRRVRPAA